MATSSSQAGGVRRLAGAVYFIAFLLVFISLLDYLGTVLPLKPDVTSWRYGAFGILSGFLLTPLLGVVLAAATAATMGHFGVLRVIAITSLVVALLGVILLLGFTLDSVEMRQGAGNPDLRSLTEKSALKAGIKLFTGAVALGWLGFSSLSLSRSARRHAKTAEAEPSRIVG